MTYAPSHNDQNIRVMSASAARIAALYDDDWRARKGTPPVIDIDDELCMDDESDNGTWCTTSSRTVAAVTTSRYYSFEHSSVTVIDEDGNETTYVESAPLDEDVYDESAPLDEDPYDFLYRYEAYDDLFDDEPLGDFYDDLDANSRNDAMWAQAPHSAYALNEEFEDEDEWYAADDTRPVPSTWQPLPPREHRSPERQRAAQRRKRNRVTHKRRDWNVRSRGHTAATNADPNKRLFYLDYGMSGGTFSEYIADKHRLNPEDAALIAELRNHKGGLSPQWLDLIVEFL